MCAFSIKTISSLCIHSIILRAMSDDTPLMGATFIQLFREKKRFLEVQMKAANLTAAHGEFLLMEAGISAELRDTVRRVTHFTTQEVTQLLTEMMSSQFLSATRNNLQTAFNAKHVSTCSPTGKMMLGFQYLFLCVSTHLYGSVQLLFVFCKPRNSFSSSSHRLN